MADVLLLGQTAGEMFMRTAAVGFLDVLQVCSYSHQQPAPGPEDSCQSPPMLSSHLISHLFNELFHEWKARECEAQLACKNLLEAVCEQEGLAPS